MNKRYFAQKQNRINILKPRFYQLLTALILCPILVRTASAQVSATVNTRKHSKIGAITVSAERRTERVQDVPTAVTVINAQTLEASGARTLRDITARVPNLFMPDYGTRLTAPVFVRGVGSRINDPSVGLYVDGVNYFDRSAFDFELHDIDQIEVLRGPQGTMFGRNTMGGIIHIVTQKPSAKRLLTGSLGYGTFNDQQYRIMGQIPIAGNELFARVSLARNSRNGFTNLVQSSSQPSSPQTGEQRTDIDFRDGWSGRAQLRWLPNEAWDVQLTVYGERDRDGGTPYAPLQRTTDAPYTAGLSGKNTFDRDMLGATLRAIYDLKHFRITSATSWQGLRNTFRIDQDFDPRDILNVTTGEQQSLITQEITASSYYTTAPVQWTLGIFAFTQGNTRSTDLFYGRDAIGFVQGITSMRTDTRVNATSARGAAVFGQITLNDLLTQGLGVTLGLRYDTEVNTLRATRSLLLANAPQAQVFTPFDQQLTFGELLPKIALKYAANQDLMLYASLSKGYKGGGFNTSAIEERNRTFGAEQSWNYEIGAKASFLENRINANVAAFWIDWTNQQVFQLVPQSGSILRNAGRTVSRGVEVDCTIRPIDELSISAAFGYTDAQFTQYIDQQTSRNSAGMLVSRTIDYAGKRIPFVPEYTANLSADYRLTLAAGQQFTRSVDFRAEVQRIGQTFWREDNTIQQVPYTLLNARITLNTSIGALSVWGKNLAGERYTTIQFFSLPNLPLYAQLGAPRMIGVQYSFTIGQTLE